MICRENVWSVSDSLSLLFTRKTRKMNKYFSGGEKRRPAIRLCPLAITRESTVQLTVTWNKLASAHSKCLFDRPLFRIVQEYWPTKPPQQSDCVPIHILRRVFVFCYLIAKWMFQVLLRLNLWLKSLFFSRVRPQSISAAFQSRYGR